MSSSAGVPRRYVLAIVGAAFFGLTACSSQPSSADGTATRLPEHSPTDFSSVAASSWEAHLRRVAGGFVAHLESPEDQFQSARMVGSWRHRAVVVAFYNDPAHSGRGRVLRQITVAGTPARLVRAPALPNYIRLDCGDEHYEVAVTDTGSLTARSKSDTRLTRALASKLIERAGCSAQ